MTRLLGCSDGTFKSYMGYTTVTDRSSKQYYYVENGWTRDDGMRMYGDRELWATGYLYGNVGDKLNIHLSSGKIILAIKVDMKQVDCHHPDGSVIEAIVDQNIVQRLGRWNGSEGLNVDYEGEVTHVEVIEGE